MRRREVDIADREDIRSVSAINFILGVWLIISPWIFSYTSSAAKWNQFGFGIGIAVLALIRYALPRTSWASWLNGLIGIWMIVAPFVINYNRAAAYWNEIIVGIVVAVLAFSNMRTYTHHATPA